MSKIKNRCIRYSLLLLFLFPLFTILSATDVRTQETVEKWITKVKLKKNAKANGYKLIFQTKETYLEAVKVTDPQTKKLIEGIHRLLYRCNQNDPETSVQLTFTRGNSNRLKIACSVPIEPISILLDEPE